MEVPMAVTRRTVLEMLAGGGAAVAATSLMGRDMASLGESVMPKGPSLPQFSPKPLPFDPRKLNGISEKLISSHHDNNYVGAVKNLNAVRVELSKATRDTPVFLVGGLRAKELVFANSMVLHEAYFGNLGGDGKSNGPATKMVTETWGSLAEWEQAMVALGQSLGGGSGWAVLNLHLPSGELMISGAGDHSQTLASSLPLLVMDMYEHAYQMDYGAAAAKYIEAFFKNVNWDEVNRRFELGQKVMKALSA
jgi:Fe-Mn family superoxide dismutase